MKILIVTPFPLIASSSGVYARDIARFMSSAGHEVLVVNVDNREIAYEEPFEVKTIMFKEAPVEFDFPCFTTHPHTENTFFSLSKDQLELYAAHMNEKLFDAINTFKPDIIHSQYTWLSSSLIGDMSSVPLITTSFGNEVHFMQQDIRYANYVSNSIEKSRFVIAPSKQVELILRESFGLDAVKLKLIYKGYDDDLFKFIDGNEATYKEYFGISDKCSKIVLYNDQLTYMKGIDVFLKTARTILSEREDVCFLIVGSGDFLSEVQKFKEEFSRNTIVVTSIAEEEKPPLLHISDVTVIPSRFEQFGINALQSFAMGTPVISSGIGELPFFINSENGKVISEIDENAFADAIKSALDKDIKSKSSFFCHQFASRNYSKTSGLMLLAKLYEYTLNEN